MLLSRILLQTVEFVERGGAVTVGEVGSLHTLCTKKSTVP